MKKELLVAGIVIALAAGSAFAGEVKEREEHQEERIAKGVASGQLTAKEAAHLEKGEARIERHREKAMADGVMTPKEKLKLNREENKLSKKIHHKKHNAKKVHAGADDAQS